MTELNDAVEKEFNRQIDRLLALKYHQIAKVTEKQFREIATPLLVSLKNDLPASNQHIPFLLVTKQELVPSELAMEKIVIKNQTGIVKMPPVLPTDFHEIKSVKVPQRPIYLLLDVNTGREFLNISPEDSLKRIVEPQRTPLTLDEGVALATLFPEILTDKERYNCIQMPGSRITDDQRIPSVWISDKRPRLGWCWDRNIHTWLGSASASKRLGAVN